MYGPEAGIQGNTYLGYLDIFRCDATLNYNSKKEKKKKEKFTYMQFKLDNGQRETENMKWIMGLYNGKRKIYN